MSQRKTIHVDKLHIILPRDVASKNRYDQEAMARLVASNLAESLRQPDAISGVQSFGELRVRVKRDQAKAAGIAHAIRASIEGVVNASDVATRVPVKRKG